MTETPAQTPPPARTTRAVNSTQTEEAAANPAPASGKYLVKTPWTCNEFHVGDTVVTPQGVELDAAAKDDVVAAAKAVRMKLTVKEAGN